MPSANADALLAEYQSLRQEIDDRRRLESTVFLFQITSVGAIFAFVLSRPTTSLLLLILPISGYLLCARYALYTLGTTQIATYIRTELSPKLGGSLEWETWNSEHTPSLKDFFFVHPAILAFPAPALIAVGWTIADLLMGSSHGVLVTICIVAVLILDLVLIVGQWKLAVRGREARIINWVVPKFLRRRP